MSYFILIHFIEDGSFYEKKQTYTYQLVSISGERADPPNLKSPPAGATKEVSACVAANFEIYQD